MNRCRNLSLAARPLARRAVALCGLLLIGACTSTTPVFDEQFGLSVRSLKTPQTLHPDAAIANRARSADGLDGRSAREVHERYVRGSSSPSAAAPLLGPGAAPPGAAER
jgi:hypothetical protein